MNNLRLVQHEGADDTLADYWRKKYEALRDESTPALITSLRSQLLTIKGLARSGDDDAMEQIGRHAALALSLKGFEREAGPTEEQSLYDSEPQTG